MRWIATVVALAASACTLGGDDDAPSFRCGPGAASCPEGESCPTVALGAGGCENLPGLFEHEPIEVDVGRVVGCVVSMPYENPFYPGQPQSCTCTEEPPPSAPHWLCPL